ncbi:MAG: fasciclin domain-containing protein, partial [Bacteroidota bacterium]
MKKMIGLRSSIFMVLALLFAFSCDDNDDGPAVQEPDMNIVETAQDTDALDSLVAALLKADENEGTNLVGTLSSEGSFTVFAPTNEAFNALFDQLDDFDDLDDFDEEAEKDILATILSYHVIPGTAALSSDLSDEQVLPTALQGESLEVRLDDGVFIKDDTTVDAEVIIANVQASNGVVHVIDKVLLPEAVIQAINGDNEGEGDSLVDIVVNTEALSILEAAVIKADLAETLSGEGPFTVFAPTDDAFVALLEILGDDYSDLDDFDEEAEIALLTDILLYHVVPGKVLAADLEEGSVPTAFEGNSLHVNASGETFVIGDASDVDANITGTDILASNGVAHTIDKVLLPQSALDFVATLNQKNLVEIVVETEPLSLLEEAVLKADLAGTLSGEGPFTVFAPTNDAFVALLDVLGDDYTSVDDFDEEAEIALLTDILLYHVVPGKVLEADLQPGSVPTAFEGNSLHVNASGDTFVIGDASDVDANITGTDILASNGVAHTIDKVLLPQSALDFVATLNLKNLVEIVVETDDLSLLEEAVLKAGLAETLSSDGPFTVFAPTNDAFVALLEVLGDDYHSLADFDEPAEIALLTDILLYHVVSGQVLEGDLQPGSVPTALQGNNLHVNGSDGSFSIGDASDVDAHITATDILASNGVAHTIDKVLLPQSALDFVASLQLKTIVEIAVETDDLDLLVEALTQADAGLVELLGGEGSFTVFAPDNHAFVDLLGLLGDDYHSIADF